MSTNSKYKNCANRLYQPAGVFSAWLLRFREAQAKNTGIGVPCGDCNACCRSKYFIHIRPEETDTLSRIPEEMLFPAPGLPSGHVLMGYDEHGFCPMYIENKCSIYENRPLTCRNYDCRIFTATGINAGDADKALINQQANRWKFDYPTEQDRDRQLAVKAAARFLRERSKSLPDGIAPVNESQLAIMAVNVFDVFLNYIDVEGKTLNLPADSIVIDQVMKAIDKFRTENPG